ncbi:ATP-binding protein [Streptomyces sp. MUM 178J]|uniref:ATP-binding protein n=1 Tax=Streptomyces sp. MUM 178J TaxID=2791991 RepID=UPI001F0445D8|nr:ATP-binding protein [Streptomyces sp. MUM 178J]WRQ82719.1 ATP-binding protein [Streptomyces sp. MUM 178J]
MTQHIPGAVVWCLAVVTFVGLLLLIRQHRITAALRRRLRLHEAALSARDEEIRHLAETRLPALVKASRDADATPVPGRPLDAELAATPYGRSLQRIVDQLSGVGEAARLRADKSAKSTLKTTMRALQALASEQQLSISEMQGRHDDPDVLQDLLEVDHANAQFGRRAQAVAVLCGSWPGRQRAASPLLEVVRGATSRIRDYRRIEVHSRVDMDVVSRAVEPVVLAVAELLDNAARHSQPNTKVEVGIRPAHNGVSIVVDDAGIGMDAGEADEAARRLSGREDIDIHRLGDPPQFGFAVIGVLAARYGFRVSVDMQSPYGGVRAVLFLPDALLNRVRFMGPPIPVQGAEAQPASPSPSRVEAGAAADAVPRAGAGAGAVPGARAAGEAPAARAGTAAPEAAARPGPPAEPSPEVGSAAPSAAGGLPKRRRRSPVRQETDASPAPARPGSQLARPPAEAASRMGAFARGTRSGRDASTDSEGNAAQ